MCPHSLYWKNLNLTSLRGTFMVLLKLSFLIVKSPWIVSNCIILSFPLIGYCLNKPNAVFKLKQGKEPWILEVEFPHRNCPGENVALVVSSEVVGAFCLLWYFSTVFFKCPVFLKMNEDTLSAYISNINHTSNFFLFIEIPHFAERFL